MHVCIYFVRMAQKVKPDIQLGFEIGGRFGKLGQLQDVELQVAREREKLPLFQEPKTQVVISRLGKKHVVQEADGDGRLELQIILTFVKLLLVELFTSPKKQDKRPR